MMILKDQQIFQLTILTVWMMKSFMPIFMKYFVRLQKYSKLQIISLILKNLFQIYLQISFLVTKINHKTKYPMMLIIHNFKMVKLRKNRKFKNLFLKSILTTRKFQTIFQSKIRSAYLVLQQKKITKSKQKKQ